MVEEVREAPVRPDDEHSGDAELTSPMPGSVVAVGVADGDRVDAGTVVVTVEAMKMEHALTAPVDGVVELLVAVGDQVKVGQPLARITCTDQAEGRVMTDFLSTGTLPDHYEQLAKTVRDFAQSVVAPGRAKHDEEHSFPYEVVSGMADMGLFGLPFPEEYGGMGGDYFALCLALEELGKVDQSVAITLEAGVSLGAMPVYRFGNEDAEAGMAAAVGKRQGAWRVRPDRGGRRHRRGGDQDDRETRRRVDWVINGSKQFITNSGTDITKLVTVTAVTGEADGKKEISSILVPVPTPGFTAEPAYNKVGWNASDTHPLSFDDVRVPQENLLGERGRGYANFLRILDEGRIAIAALSVGAAQGCVDECVKYAKEREAFGTGRSARIRPSRSRSPGWRPAHTRPAPPTTTPPR